MRRVLIALAAFAASAACLPSAAEAQASREQRQQDARDVQAQGRTNNREPRIAPLRRRPNAGACPYVKVLYDAARYVEIQGERAAVANVGYTGEIQGVGADCVYRDDDPITVGVNILFDFGRGPQATTDQRTYRYWVAVTERNRAILAKEYFDLPVDFRGAQTATETVSQTIVIPRADMTTNGANFEILVGFDVTPEMAEFNRTGSRFRVNAGQTAPATQ